MSLTLGILTKRFIPQGFVGQTWYQATHETTSAKFQHQL